MDKEKIDRYSFKVTQANKTQLVVLVYDIIMDDIKTAMDEFAAGDIDQFVSTVKHGQRFVQELMRTVDCQYTIGLDLMTLYLYVNKMMIKAIIQRNPDALEGLPEVIGKLQQAFDSISRTDYSGPVMQNTEQVYAGLTYNKRDLSEAYLDAGNQLKRGFTV